MAINAWPHEEQPRQKLLSKGPQALSDAEVLAILIRTGSFNKSAVELSRDLISKHGNLRSLLDLHEEDLCSEKGIGSVTYVNLQACLELGRRYLEQSLEYNEGLGGSRDTKRFLRSKLRHQTREVFACLFLNSQHQIIRYEEVFYGTLDSATVYPRVIVEKSLAHNAAAVILAHNHPSGHPEPSDADKGITKILCSALALIDIKVLDHIVVGNCEEVSFAERGLI